MSDRKPRNREDLIHYLLDIIENGASRRDVLKELEFQKQFDFDLSTADDPVGICNQCERKTFEMDEIGEECGMEQPDGSTCEGKFIDIREADAKRENGIKIGGTK